MGNFFTKNYVWGLWAPLPSKNNSSPALAQQRNHAFNLISTKNKKRKKKPQKPRKEKKRERKPNRETKR